MNDVSNLIRDVNVATSKLQKYILEEIKIEVESRLRKEYESLVEKFYGEYKPKVYKRVNNDDDISGSFDTQVSKNEKNGKGFVKLNFHTDVGVDVSYQDEYGRIIYPIPEELKEDYKIRRIEAYKSFLDGYHGNITGWRGIKRREPYKLMKKLESELKDGLEGHAILSAAYENAYARLNAKEKIFFPPKY